MIPAGTMRHRITIQSPPADRDTRGRLTGDWVTIAQASAEIKPLAGTEAERAKQLLATATHQITLRARTDFALTSKQRFLFGTRVFHIGHIINMEEVRAVWVCLATEERP